MAVPLLNLTEQNNAQIDAYRAAFDRVMASGHFIMGGEVERFEAACAQALEVKHAIGVSSGTDALLLAVMALGFGPGDEIICPSFTFFASGGSIARTGATAVFADVDPVTFNLDPADVERKLTRRTRAIMPVHLYGQSADMDALNAIAKAHKLFVIEDAAQAFGARYKGKRVGGLGDFGCFSFFPSKNLGGFGDAGLLTTNDDELAQQARILRVHGMEPKYFHQLIGGNFRIDALQAALLNVKLPEHEGYHTARAANAAYYNEQFAKAGIGAIAGAAGAAGDSLPLVLPSQSEGNTHIWNQYSVRVKDTLGAQTQAGAAPATGGLGGDKPSTRDALRTYLLGKGIGCEVYYPVPLHRQECFSHLAPVELPVSEQLAAEVLSLPVFPELKREQLDEVVAAVTAFFRG